MYMLLTHVCISGCKRILKIYNSFHNSRERHAVGNNQKMGEKFILIKEGLRIP
jgi:hypothetical protein